MLCTGLRVDRQAADRRRYLTKVRETLSLTDRRRRKIIVLCHRAMKPVRLRLRKTKRLMSQKKHRKVKLRTVLFNQRKKSRLQKNSRKKLIHTLKNRMIFITFILKAHISKHLGYSGSYFRLRMHLKTMKEYQLL